MLKQNIAKLLESEMDRKDFLKTLGITVAAVTGATAALKTISAHSAMISSTRPQQQTGKLGYGASAYGGVRTVQQSTNSYS